MDFEAWFNAEVDAGRLYYTDKEVAECAWDGAQRQMGDALSVLQRWKEEPYYEGGSLIAPNEDGEYVMLEDVRAALKIDAARKAGEVG